MSTVRHSFRQGVAQHFPQLVKKGSPLRANYLLPGSEFPSDPLTTVQFFSCCRLRDREVLLASEQGLMLLSQVNVRRPEALPQSCPQLPGGVFLTPPAQVLNQPLPSPQTTFEYPCVGHRLSVLFRQGLEFVPALRGLLIVPGSFRVATAQLMESIRGRGLTGFRLREAVPKVRNQSLRTSHGSTQNSQCAARMP